MLAAGHVAFIFSSLKLPLAFPSFQLSGTAYVTQTVLILENVKLFSLALIYINMHLYVHRAILNA